MLSILPTGTIDIPIIRKLAHDIWPATYSTILSAGQLEYMLQQIYSEEALLKQMEEGQQFYIAYSNNQSVGFAAIGPYDTAIYKLFKIYLSLQIQGKGAGKQLMQYAIDRAKANKAKSLILNVNRNNPAIYFYKKIGFKITEEEDIDIGNGFFMNDFIMKLAL